MNLLVTYDVRTVSPEGRRRLRRVAQVCCDFGRRVQDSVFEVVVGDVELVRFRQRLLDEIDAAEDSLCLYRIAGDWSKLVERHGIDRSFDFEGPLVV